MYVDHYHHYLKSNLALKNIPKFLGNVVHLEKLTVCLILQMATNNSLL